VVVTLVVVAIAGVLAVVWLRSDEERIIVPDVVGLSIERAEQALDAPGLALGDVEYVSVDADSAEADTVVSQLPRAGTEVEAGAEVALVAARIQEEAREGADGGAPSGGSSGGSGSSSGAEGDITIQPGAQSAYAWRTVAADSGAGDYLSSTFTATSTRLRLTTTLSTTSGAGMIGFNLVRQGSVGSVEQRLATFPATPDAASHVQELDISEGTYRVRVQAPNYVEWQFRLHVWSESTGAIESD
jgi:hypothetical protein